MYGCYKLNCRCFPRDTATGVARCFDSAQLNEKCACCCIELVVATVTETAVFLCTDNDHTILRGIFQDERLAKVSVTSAGRVLKQSVVSSVICCKEFRRLLYT
ncbi:hypothetical protein NP493_1497g00020 [Ridgeia piscesae]|uniref:Uncharacterized protein n=1 Tax=Ridgeia piscesae TaxID=27915 RepID=A0AAD9K114_RIDPI|nr:hypothetical protein NP493_1497g00020 [Ridgeia piscesae]